MTGLGVGEALDFRFGDFEIDTARHELRRAGAVVHIEPQVFDLIVHLVRNHDRIVSKDELIDAIWQGRIVSEATLSSRISAARRALGPSFDHSAKPCCARRAIAGISVARIASAADATSPVSGSIRSNFIATSS